MCTKRRIGWVSPAIVAASAWLALGLAVTSAPASLVPETAPLLHSNNTWISPRSPFTLVPYKDDRQETAEDPWFHSNNTMLWFGGPDNRWADQGPGWSTASAPIEPWRDEDLSGGSMLTDHRSDADATTRFRLDDPRPGRPTLDAPPTPPVPGPGGLGLLGVAAGALLGRGRRRNARPLR